MLKILFGSLLVIVFFYYFFQESKKVFPVFVSVPYPPIDPYYYPPRRPKSPPKSKAVPRITHQNTKLPQPTSPVQQPVQPALPDVSGKAIDHPIEPEPKSWLIQCKAPGQITPEEYQSLQGFWNSYLINNSFFKEADMGLKDNALIFLAHSPENNQVIGQANILVLDQHDIHGFFSKLGSLNLDFSSLILYNVCVDANHRKQGVATKLMEAVEYWARTNNKHKIILFVKSENQVAINLYLKCGYQIDQNYFPTSGKQGEEYLMIKTF